MTRKERKALLQKQYKAVSDLISPHDPIRTYYDKEVKFDEHCLATLIQLTGLKKVQVVTGIANYYQTIIQPVNPCITAFRFAEVLENGWTVIKVYAIIRVNLKPQEKKVSSGSSSGMSDFDTDCARENAELLR